MQEKLKLAKEAIKFKLEKLKTKKQKKEETRCQKQKGYKSDMRADGWEDC